jgi:nucleotide-binding universal stress UspA family protein
VLTVPHMSREKTILVPHDFGEPADDALEMALSLAPKLDAAIAVMHAYEPPNTAYPLAPFPILDVTPSLAKASQSAIDAIVARTTGRWPRTQGLVRSGKPWREILAAASELGAEMIIMGTAGRKGIERALLGSVAEKVVRAAEIPVITVHHREKK